MNECKKFKIIDPHVHYWDLALGYNGWLMNRENGLLGPLDAINKNYLQENYEKDSRNFTVDSIVHIEAVTTKYSKNEINWLEGLYKYDYLLGGVVAGVDLLDENIEFILESYSNHQLVKGVRQLLNWSENSKYTAADRKDDLLNINWKNNFVLLRKYDMSFDMQICPEQMLDAMTIAQLHPDIMIVIDHAGMPIVEYIDTWRKGITELALCPNIFVKLSGFGMFNHHWKKETIVAYIEHIINCFGVNRCMFASNFPVDKLYSSYDNLMTSYIEIAQKYFYQDINKLFYHNAKNFYKL